VKPRHQLEQLAIASRLRQRQVLNVIVEVQVRVVIPVERTEASQRAVGGAVSKGLAKLGGGPIEVTEPGHELPLVGALGEFEQGQPPHVHRCFGSFKEQKAGAEKIDPVHAQILPERGGQSARHGIGSFNHSTVR
jgi:hypothetical protein